MKRTIFALSAILLAWPAAQAQEDQAPYCETPRECEVMWSSAIDSLSILSSMKIRLMTDTRVETYGPIHPADIAAVITKKPKGAAGYEISIQFQCGWTCPSSLVASGSKYFNSTVNTAKSILQNEMNGTKPQ